MAGAGPGDLVAPGVEGAVVSLFSCLVGVLPCEDGGGEDGYPPG